MAAINTEIEDLETNIMTIMSEDSPIYQSSKSNEIKSNISKALNSINRSTYSYVLDINKFIRNNIKDSSFLKKALIEKVHGNMGD